MKTKTTNTKPATDDIESLIKSLGSASPAARMRARKRLVAAGHAVVIPLLHKLKARSDQMCWEAAKALSEIKDAASADALAETLDHANHDVRWLAAEGLIAIGQEGLKQTLMALLTRAKSICVREGAHHVISHFAHRMSGNYLIPVLRDLENFEPAVLAPPAALDALHEMQNRKAARGKR